MDRTLGKILVVDDNEMNRDLLSRRLARKGHTVEVAEGGHRALEMIGDRAFDLVLLDIMMPGIDGFEVLEKIPEAHESGGEEFGVERVTEVLEEAFGEGLSASIDRLLGRVWEWGGGTGPGDDVSILAIEIEDAR